MIKFLDDQRRFERIVNKMMKLLLETAYVRKNVRRILYFILCYTKLCSSLIEE